MKNSFTEHPVSMTELGVYFDWQKNLQGTAYNIPLLIELPKGTDIARLKDALTEVLRSHCNMLSRFGRKADGNVVRLLPEDPANYEIKIQEITGEPDTDKLVYPFTDPDEELYRISLIKGASQDYLFFDFHHIIFDGTSLKVFLEDVDSVYSGGSPRLEKVTASGFAAKEQERRNTDEFKAAEKWYNELITDPEIISTLVHDKEEGEQKNSCLTVPIDVTKEQVASYVHNIGIKTSALFTGAYGFVLSRFAGTEDALYATIYTGRKEEIANDIGMFVKTFPVTERYDGKESIAEHLKNLNDQIVKSREADLFSFAVCCTRLHLTVPTIFAYQGELEAERDFLGGKTVPRVIQSDAPKEEIVAEVFRDAEGYKIRVSYRTDIFEEESIKIFAKSYGKAVAEFIARDAFDEVDITTDEQITMLDSSFLNPLRWMVQMTSYRCSVSRLRIILMPRRS